MWLKITTIIFCPATHCFLGLKCLTKIQFIWLSFIFCQFTRSGSSRSVAPFFSCPEQLNSQSCTHANLPPMVPWSVWYGWWNIQNFVSRNIFQIMWLYRMWDDFLTEVVDHISWRSIMCGSERPNKRRDPPWISVFASLFQASRFGLKVIEGNDWAKV